MEPHGGAWGPGPSAAKARSEGGAAGSERGRVAGGSRERGAVRWRYRWGFGWRFRAECHPAWALAVQAAVSCSAHAGAAGARPGVRRDAVRVPIARPLGRLRLLPSPRPRRRRTARRAAVCSSRRRSRRLDSDSPRLPTRGSAGGAGPGPQASALQIPSRPGPARSGPDREEPGSPLFPSARRRRLPTGKGGRAFRLGVASQTPTRPVHWQRPLRRTRRQARRRSPHP